jgi:hypothetical protein
MGMSPSYHRPRFIVDRFMSGASAAGTTGGECDPGAAFPEIIEET